MFIAALATMAKLWRKPKCPSTDEWIIFPFAMNWTKLEHIMLSKISQSEKEIPYDFTHMWNLRNKADEHMGRGGGERGERGTNHKRLLTKESKLRVDGREMTGRWTR